jgi:phosphatidylserine synthase
MKSTQKLNVSNPNVLLGLSAFLILLGGMMTDPLADGVCFALAGIIAAAAWVKGKRWTRWLAFGFIMIAAALAVHNFPEARRHWDFFRRK